MQKTRGLSHCRFCGRKLSAFRMLFTPRSDFCSTSHRTEYTLTQNELGLVRLLEGTPKAVAEIRWERCEMRMRSSQAAGLNSFAAKA